MVRIVDWTLAAVLFGFGCLHNLTAFQIYDRVDEKAIFFTGSGLALWFAAAINAARLRHPDLGWMSMIANALLAALLIAGVAAIPDFRSPIGWLLVAVVLGLWMLSLRGLWKNPER